MAFGGLLINSALVFSTNVINSPVVSQGFQITLTIANLGFVIGIIVIALATIFRSQTYGVKKLLTSLVAMAILVNFGLVISGVLLNFSDQLSNYFIKNSTSNGRISDFADSLVAVSQPQQLWIDPNKDSSTSIWNKGLRGAANVVIPGGATGFEIAKALLSKDNWTAWLQQLIALIFIGVFSMILSLALIVVGIMFFLRYFWLTFLLIMLPLAWLSWVFPALKKHWSDWWQHFIKWAFFGPVALFFMYLAVVIAQGGGTDYLTETLGNMTANDNVAALATQTARSGDFWASITRELIVVGLIFGGLMAANKMGIAFAGTAINGAKAAGGWIQGATKRVAKRTEARAFGGERMGKISKGMQEIGAKYHIAPLRGIGQGIDALRGQGRGVVEDYKKIAGAKSAEQILNQIGATRGSELVAYLKAAQDKNILPQAVGAVTKVAPGAINKDIFQNAGEMKLFGELKSVSGLAYKDFAERRNKPDEDLDKLEKEARESIKALAGDKAVGFFAPFSKDKPVLGMTDETEYKNFQKEIARDILKFGNPSKIQKFWEEAGDDQVSEFKRAAKDNNLNESDVNPQLLKWLRSGKGREMFDPSDFGIKTASITPTGAQKTETEKNKREAEATIQGS